MNVYAYSLLEGVPVGEVAPQAMGGTLSVTIYSSSSESGGDGRRRLSVSERPTSDLQNPFRFVLPHDAVAEGAPRHCVYLDTVKGYYSEEGCEVDLPACTASTTVCLCKHLTGGTVVVAFMGAFFNRLVFWGGSD